MRTMTTMTAAMLLLASCGEAEAPTADTPAGQAADRSGMDHGAADPGGAAMGAGRVVSVEGERRLRIEHGAIEAVGMAAMTMTFEALRDVDLGGIEAGDEVHFLLDRGRDGTFRLAAICDIAAADHEACMAAMTAGR